MILKNNTRKEQAKITKEKIFETAVKLITKYGYDNVSVSSICKEAGVAKGTFYVHYNSKEDIIRESYYSDMTNYITNQFNIIKSNNPAFSLKQYIIEFLSLEFKFTEHAGYELTCLAFATNFSSCIPGPCRHFEKRTFTYLLKSLITEAADKKLLKSGLSAEDAFTYLETAVRGMMATWCFSNGDFNIVTYGQKYITDLVNNFFSD